MFNIRVKYKDEVKSRVTATVGEYSNYLENMLHVMAQNANIDWVRIERKANHNPNINWVRIGRSES